MKSREFALRQTYTRAQIREALGGDLASELPHLNGRVVCGCFSPGSSPDAPDVILSGRGPEIERWTQVFAAQRYFIPCFLQVGIHAWEYMGRFLVRRVISDIAQIRVRAKAAARPANGLTAILYLQGEFRPTPGRS